MARDVFCHFLKSKACYEHDNGESTEVRGNTVAFFPEGWTGACRVTKTVKKPYVIR